jgi:hypothetical protein
MAKQKTKEGGDTVATVSSFKPISEDKLQQLKTRGGKRGVYDHWLRTFIESGSPGEQVDLDGGQFEDRKPQTVKQGFDLARKRLAEPKDGREPVDTSGISVVVDESLVYIIRTDI